MWVTELNAMSNAIYQFIKSNRQSETTSALVNAVKENGGYLIVGTAEQANQIWKEHPELENGVVFTKQNFLSNNFRGWPPAPLFFDTSFIQELIREQIFCDGDNPSFWMDVNKTYGYHPVTDGYKTDGYHPITDGYGVNNKQINVKLTEDDVKDVNFINNMFFEGEASNSMIGRILLRKGISFYKKLMNQ